MAISSGIINRESPVLFLGGEKAVQPIDCIGGDFIGKGSLRFGVLWFGPSPRKFKGFKFSKPRKRYSRSDVVKVTEMGQEQAKSFVGASAAAGAGALLLGGIGLVAGALAGGNKHKIIVGVEFADGKKAAFSIKPNNKPYACLKLYAIKKNLLEHSF